MLNNYDLSVIRHRTEETERDVHFKDDNWMLLVSARRTADDVWKLLDYIDELTRERDALILQVESQTL